MKLPVTSVESGALSPRYLGIHPRPATRASGWAVGRGEDRQDLNRARQCSLQLRACRNGVN